MEHKFDFYHWPWPLTNINLWPWHYCSRTELHNIEMSLIFNHRGIHEESILKSLFIKINFDEITSGPWMAYKACSCKLMEKIIGDFYHWIIFKIEISVKIVFKKCNLLQIPSTNMANIHFHELWIIRILLQVKNCCMVLEQSSVRKNIYIMDFSMSQGFKTVTPIFIMETHFTQQQISFCIIQKL